MDDSAIDIEARDRIAALDKRFTGLANDYWGPNQDNGTRSMVREHAAEIESIKTEYRHYLDTLPERCLGLKAVADHEARDGLLYDETIKEDTEMTIAKEGNRTKLSEARLSLLGIVLVAIMSLIGTVVQAQANQVTQRQLGTLTQAVEASK